VADATTYHENHGDPTVWVNAVQADHEDAIRQATQYVDAKYGLRWKGVRSEADQALDWPRDSAYDRDGYPYDDDGAGLIPQPLVDAVCVLALKVLEGDDLFEDSNPGGEGSEGVLSERVKVGSIEEEIEYMGSKPTQKRYILAERLLSDLTDSKGEALRG